MGTPATQAHHNLPLLCNLVILVASESVSHYLSSQAGALMSPNFPNDYGNDEDVKWFITVPSYVQLTVRYINTEKCCDTLDIYDGLDTKGSHLLMR